jgi:hypothetical protein
MPPRKAAEETAPRTGTRARSRTQTAKQAKEAPASMMEATVEIEEVTLASIRTSTNVLIQGPPGGGKTALAGGAPNAVFLSTEIEGAISAAISGSRARLWPAPSWEYCVAGVKKAEEELTEDDWLIVDSGTNMQEMYMRWILDTINERSPHRDLDIPSPAEHQKYQNGFKRWYNRIIGMKANTIFITNSMTVEDDEGNPRTIPLILGKKGEISDYISAQAGVVLYYSVSRESRETEATGPAIVRRALAQPFPPWLAKDRYDALGTYWDVEHGDYTAMAKMIDAIERAKKEMANGRKAEPTRRVVRSRRPAR